MFKSAFRATSMMAKVVNPNVTSPIIARGSFGVIIRPSSASWFACASVRNVVPCPVACPVGDDMFGASDLIAKLVTFHVSVATHVFLDITFVSVPSGDMHL